MAAGHRYDDVALIFEGGAMRASYTAPVVDALLEAGIQFPIAYGTSAGSMLAACYVSQNPMRAKATFVDSVGVKSSGGVMNFLKGQGFYNIQLIFEGMSEMHAMDHDEWTFDFKTFKESPTGFHTEAFERDTGATVAWEKADIHTLTDLMLRVEASSAYPLFINPCEVDGVVYVDGGEGTSRDICVDAARHDGFERYFIVCTQPRGYRMPQISPAKRATYAAVYHKYPKLYNAILKRPDEYNQLLGRIEKMEREGSAYVFYPDTMPVVYDTTDLRKLQHSYELGMEQCNRDLPKWIEWLDQTSNAK